MGSLTIIQIELRNRTGYFPVLEFRETQRVKGLTVDAISNDFVTQQRDRGDGNKYPTV